MKQLTIKAKEFSQQSKQMWDDLPWYAMLIFERESNQVTDYTEGWQSGRYEGIRTILRLVSSQSKSLMRRRL